MIAIGFTAVMVMLTCAWASERPAGYRATWRQRRAWARERADVTPALRGRR